MHLNKKGCIKLNTLIDIAIILTNCSILGLLLHINKISKRVRKLEVEDARRIVPEPAPQRFNNFAADSLVDYMDDQIRHKFVVKND